jgi:hypothetical protein
MFGYQYDPYQMSLGYTQPVVTHFSIDVECVATGTDHNSRSVAQIALVVSRTDYFPPITYTSNYICFAHGYAGPIREGLAECVSASQPEACSNCSLSLCYCHTAAFGPITRQACCEPPGVPNESC